MFHQDIVQGRPVIDDNIVGSEKGFGNMTAIAPTIYKNIIMVTGDFYTRLMNQKFRIHGRLTQ
ncbi:MAG TPA: hypothetical protein VJ955_03090 [Desulfuromonadales bacterium]|nr:hypothetical protein [Desulfuromonadales bacterium]